MIRTLFVVTIISILVIAWFIAYERKLAVHTHLLTKITPHDNCPLTFHSDSLVSCHESDDRCTKCNEYEPRICTEVSDQSPYKYKLNHSSKELSVPNGKWCLPPKTTDLKCNPMSGDPVLTKQGRNYIWRCQCKYPKLVDNTGVYGDCSEIAACGAKLDGQTNTLVCPPRSEVCTPGEPWSDNPTWNPTAAVCRCGPGQVYLERGENKLCVEDPCDPGVTDPNNPEQCICPQPVTDDEGNKVSFVSHNGQCIEDPCNPLGTFDGRTCICEKPNTVAQLDVSSPLQWSCASPCDWKNNPCGTRGTCNIDSNGRAICTNCMFPNYQSKDKRCNNVVKPQYARCSNNRECESLQCGKYCKTQGWGWIDHPVCCPNNF